MPTNMRRGLRGEPAAGERPGARSSGEDRRDLFLDERLDDVARLEVLEAVETDAAVEAGAHLGGVVLEAAQRSDLALVDDPAVAHQADGGGARDDAVDDVAAGDRADLRAP